ncbi:class I SAM-dependent methyltransferase [Pseudoalteromonas sp. JBTF-M23]|uniref:Class I SAM-dependent methyltransferase n=1 Tax=Pseudoalteromonas caenipelagi TaxID=2726988 RepID=A0A849VGN1_9GAMM|nr:class I SAM-dependent methyltransferase [Pseudoalteromonas caenipelagi]NOU51024.1 class I SAM-dependent methyltransferase [Pseudoalteromonas caenipelagi]
MQTNIDDTRFNIIAQSYEYAIAKYPDARRDGDWLIEQLDAQPDETILEISAGTGFLTEQIAPQNIGGKLIVQDIAPNTLEINKTKVQAFSHLEYLLDLNELDNESCDKAVSLGGWHHMEDQIWITKTALAKVKPGGYFCVGDFADSSSIQRYFDEVVDNITSTGHQGLFPSYSRMINLGRFARASKTVVEEFDVPFAFDSDEEIGEFFQKVFALEQDHLDTAKDIRKYFEIKEEDGKLKVMVPYIYAKFYK